MPTSSGGLRYPALTDAVNVPGDMQKLAEDVDTFKAPVSNPTFAGTATFPAGTATAPSITTTGDTNTGIFFPAADSVGIATAGTARVVIGSAGQITGVLGAVGSPTYSFTGDTNTGAYSPTADNYSIATAGTQRVNVDSNGLITGTGSSLGAWVSYTPVISNGWGIGNGTATGAYCQIGKVVHFRCAFTFGSTSTFAAAATIEVNYPLEAAALWAGPIVAHYFDTSAGVWYNAVSREQSTVVFRLHTPSTNGQFTQTNATTPFTWASGDILRVAGTYEIL